MLLFWLPCGRKHCYADGEGPAGVCAWLVEPMGYMVGVEPWQGRRVVSVRVGQEHCIRGAPRVVRIGCEGLRFGEGAVTVPVLLPSTAAITLGGALREHVRHLRGRNRESGRRGWGGASDVGGVL